MTENTRERILKRLRTAVSDRQDLPVVPPVLQTPPLSRDEKLEQLKTLMAAMRAEVHVVPSESWTDRLKEILRAKELGQMLYAPGTPVGDAVKEAWAGGGEGLPGLRAYDAAVETFKDELFTIDAGITGTAGGIAETGALILWPEIGRASCRERV